MACPVPFLKKMSDGSLVPLPCGHCVQCRIDKRNEWTWRLQSEIKNTSSVFVTLTIDDDHMLPSRSVYKRSVQLFLKRLRKFSGKKIKYFFVSEYGELDHRPHYHGIIIGLSAGKPMSYDVGDIPSIRKSWSYGFINVKPASKGSIRYVLKYLDKDDDLSMYPTLEPTFRLMSKGLGSAWIKSSEPYLTDDNTFYFDGAYRPLPRYYKEKLGLSFPNRNDYSDVTLVRRVASSKSDSAAVKDIMARYDWSFDKAYNWLGRQKLVSLASRQNVQNKFIKGVDK